MDGHKSLIVAKMRNLYTEYDALYEVEKMLLSGGDDLVLDSRSNKKITWIVEYLYGCIPGHVGIFIRLYNMRVSWPKYPNSISINKPVGTTYKERIKKSFEELQYVIDNFYWMIAELFDRGIILDPDWHTDIETGIDIICTAYELEIKDSFNLRSGLKIFRPDANSITTIKSDINEFFKKRREYHASLRGAI